MSERWFCTKCGKEMIHTSKPYGGYNPRTGEAYLIHIFTCPDYQEVRGLFSTKSNGHDQYITNDDPASKSWD